MKTMILIAAALCLNAMAGPTSKEQADALEKKAQDKFEARSKVRDEELFGEKKSQEMIDGDTEEGSKGSE